MKYTKEDLKDDCDWLEGYGIKPREAEEFIKYLLGRIKNE